MSEHNGAEKGSMWSTVTALITRAPLLLLILGVALVLIAAAGGWPQHVSIDREWRIAVAVLGGLLICFGAVLVRQVTIADQGSDVPSSKQAGSYGVTITFPHPGTDAQVKKPGPKAYFEVKGKVKKLPRDAQIWVFVLASDGRRWPHGPAEIVEQDWTVHEVYPGTGARKQIEVYVVGKNGQILIRYYKTTGREMGAAREQINEAYPNTNLQIRTPAITELTTDMVKCRDLSVTLTNNG